MLIMNKNIDDTRRVNDQEDQDDFANNSETEGLKKVNGEVEQSKMPDQHPPKFRRSYVPGRGFDRYDNSLKTLIPFRKRAKCEESAPIDNAGLCSSINTTWISEFMYKAFRKGLEMEDLPKVSPYDACDYNAERLELLWKKEASEKGPEKASLSRAAWRFCRTRIIASTVVLTLAILSGFIGYILCMRRLLEHIESGTGEYREGVKWALLLTLTELARALFTAWAWSMNARTALRLRSSCLTLLYRKIISLNNVDNKDIGQVINIFSNDAERIIDAVHSGPTIIQAPILTVCGLFFVLWLLGPMAFLGMLSIFLFFPIQYAVCRLVAFYQRKTVKVSDLRIRLMNEILECVKLMKMYAWEKRFSQDLLATRNTELRLLLKTSYWKRLNNSLTPTYAVICMTITFLAHVFTGHNLTAAQVFPIASFINARLRTSLVTFRVNLEVIVLAGISFNRIEKLLLLEDSKCSISEPIVKSQAVAIVNGKFSYHTDGSSLKRSNKRSIEEKSPVVTDEQEELTKTGDHAQGDVLSDISFAVEKGKLVGICGQVGSGKSSLLLAALGQLRASEGQVTRAGSCAYVSQQAWITNATLRENILFGAQFDHSRYYKAIHACNLSQDIGMMPGDDRTEIGEKGVNLSGGQKQRVALARALYADRDIYFLDDPLSAVDAKVGSYLFDNLILGALSRKTVLFVTHQIQYLNRCDDIYMMRDGRIIEHGTHDELMKLGNEYASMVTAISTDNKSEDKMIEALQPEVSPESVDDLPTPEVNQSAVISTKCDVTTKPNTAGTQLTVDENLQRGTIKPHTRQSYIVAAGGYFVCLLVFISSMGSAGLSALSSWWLALWIKAGGGNATIVRNNETVFSDNINDNPNFSYYQSIYGGITVILILVAGLSSLIFTKATTRASKKLHRDLFDKVISAPMRFFDTTPIGRVQHLFSRDMDEVDHLLPSTLSEFLHTFFVTVFAVLVVSLVIPWSILPSSIFVSIIYFASKIFRVAIRDMKRMENKSRAPMISLVSATVQGLSTIHAFEKQTAFKSKFSDLLDENGKYLFLCRGAAQWLVTRIDLMAVAITSVTAFLVVALGDQVPPALAGLALTYSAQIAGVFQYAIRMASELEVRFLSVERINDYIRTLRGEGEATRPTIEPSSAWPDAAEIKFTDVSMAYGEGAPVVLKNVSISIGAGEKIGIVGRTGSGKSSLTVALFRLVELAEGKIEIDGVDISEIGLEQLRTKLSIIPQDPVLFSGTIRSNLDPFKLYTDAEIWEALEKTELKGRVQSLTGHLDAAVGFGGDTFSVGERQLLCLSRALLRNSKILVLDEATAAVDPETEVAVQKTVQQEFSHCTILTIAHRLKTVLPLDRILVMEDGKVLEFDTPSNLLSDQCSEFSKMMAAAEQAEGRGPD